MPTLRSNSINADNSTTMADEIDNLEIRDWFKRIDSRLDKLDRIEESITALKTESATHSKQIESLSTRVDELSSKSLAQEESIKSVDSKVVTANAEVNTLRAQVRTMSEKLNDLEQYSKRDNLVISGLCFKMPYSSTTREHQFVSDDGNDINREEENGKWSPRDRTIMAGNFVDFAKQKLNVDMSIKDILDIHIMPSRDGNKPFASHQKKTTKTLTIVRFNNRRVRDEIYGARMNLKHSREQIFINEHLTKPNSDLYYKARMAKKDKKIADAWTSNGRIAIKLFSGAKKMVTSIEQLTQLMK